MKRIGIFAGTFDPVHKGHVAFALKAAESAELDEVYFLPETRPRGKDGATHISHRIAMLNLATRIHRKLKVLELPDKQFDMARTWPRLKQRFKDSELLLMVGSDVFNNLPNWPYINLLFEDAGVVVATRGEREIAHTLQGIVSIGQPLWEVHIVESDHPNTSSRIIRSAIGKGHDPDVLLESIRRYISQNWLYVDMRSAVSK